jgi:hypothetical protein
MVTGALVAGAGVAQAANGSGGSNGGSSGSNGSSSNGGSSGSNGSSGGSNGSNNSSSGGGNVKVGPNGKLSSDGHTISVAVKVKCQDKGKLGVAAKVKQGDNTGKGTTTVQCTKGDTKTVTVAATNGSATFTTGAARACVATAKNQKSSSGAKCRDINVVS